MKVLGEDALRLLLQYDAGTGVFTWLDAAGPVGAGEVAGTLGERGYIRIQVKGRIYRAHRLAWLYMTGTWPMKGVDHINGNKADNRWANLREADQFANLQNQRRAHSNSSTGLLGVTSHGDKFRARITHDGQDTSLGLHDTPELAYAAYVEAKRALHAGNTL